MVGNRVIPKHRTATSGAPSASQLEIAELAINTKDKKLFSKDADGKIFELFINQRAIFSAVGTKSVNVNNDTIIDFDDLNVGGNYKTFDNSNGKLNTTTGVFTVPENGKYKVECFMIDFGSENSSSSKIYIYVNGSEVAKKTYDHIRNQHEIMDISATLNLITNDTVQIKASGTNNTNGLLGIGSETRFGISKG